MHILSILSTLLLIAMSTHGEKSAYEFFAAGRGEPFWRGGVAYYTSRGLTAAQFNRDAAEAKEYDEKNRRAEAARTDPKNPQGGCQ